MALPTWVLSAERQSVKISHKPLHNLPGYNWSLWVLWCFARVLVLFLNLKTSKTGLKIVVLYELCVTGQHLCIRGLLCFFASAYHTTLAAEYCDCLYDCCSCHLCHYHDCHHCNTRVEIVGVYAVIAFTAAVCLLARCCCPRRHCCVCRFLCQKLWLLLSLFLSRIWLFGLFWITDTTWCCVCLLDITQCEHM